MAGKLSDAGCKICNGIKKSTVQEPENNLISKFLLEKLEENTCCENIS